MFHPQTDGLAEKANGTIQPFLRAYAADNLQEWDRHLALAEFTYNALKHKTLKMSPFELDIGYVPRLSLDIIASTYTEQGIYIQKYVPAFPPILSISGNPPVLS
jgi:hypothetical protein